MLTIYTIESLKLITIERKRPTTAMINPTARDKGNSYPRKIMLYPKTPQPPEDRIGVSLILLSAAL